MPLEHTSEPLVHPYRSLLVRGAGQAMELQRTALIPHVHAIEREHMEADVEPQGCTNGHGKCVTAGLDVP